MKHLALAISLSMLIWSGTNLIGTLWVGDSLGWRIASHLIFIYVAYMFFIELERWIEKVGDDG